LANPTLLSEPFADLDEVHTGLPGAQVDNPQEA
jgi:hypothetical protein